MNPTVQRLFSEYATAPGVHSQVAAAVLVLADVLSRPTSEPPEPIIVEPDGCHSYSVKETAARLNLSSKTIYQMILAGVLHCFRSGTAVRIPLTEIERLEADMQTTALVPR